MMMIHGFSSLDIEKKAVKLKTYNGLTSAPEPSYPPSLEDLQLSPLSKPHYTVGLREKRSFQSLKAEDPGTP